ncbi:PTS system, lactose-specific IIBC component [Streptococcus infantarius subsp. infantarius]|nr:PTS system, lactose-specific IIBC component [Streptococcus infantarius subsp. infantarius]
MPKEVPGTISQTFRDIFPFSFAEAVITLLQPLFTAADGYLGIAIIWGCYGALLVCWLHGPSIVEPAIAAIIYANVETNLQLLKA